MEAEIRGVIGAVVGLGIGVVDYVVLSRVMEQAMLDGRMKRETGRLIVKAAGLTGLIAFPIVGYVIGRFVLG